MSGSNTIIQILRSYSNTSPTSLADGELAYSFVSNTLFIGERTGKIVPIGGLQYINNTVVSIVSTLDGGSF